VRQAIVLTAIALAVLLVPAPNLSAAPADRHIRVEAGMFEYAPFAISINPGDRVTIDLVSTDVVHGLYIDGYDLSVTSDPGQTQSLRFVADKPGSFRFRCSVTCGALHPFMIGKLDVGPNWTLMRGIGLAGLAVVAAAWLIRK
jgi:heme/copper-type cytochrome/quinol oxidase subunit 2